MDTDPPREVPTLPSIDEQVHVRARVQAYGSPQVKALLDEYFALIRDIREADRTIARALEDGGDDAGRMQVRTGHVADYMRTWTDLNNLLRPAERVRREKLVKRIADELSL
jgi:hypothetical protein